MTYDEESQMLKTTEINASYILLHACWAHSRKTQSRFKNSFGMKVIIRKDSEWPSMVYQEARDLEQTKGHTIRCYVYDSDLYYV